MMTVLRKSKYIGFIALAGFIVASVFWPVGF